MDLSTRIGALSEAADPASAVERFWSALPSRPVVEPDPGGDPGQRLVTFLCRDRESVGVLLLLNTIVDRHRHDLRPVHLDQVPGTDLWHRTVRLPANLRLSYQFLPVAEETVRVASAADWMAMRVRARPDPGNPETAPHWMPGVRASALALPDAPEQPYVRRRPGQPAGTVTRYEISGPDLSGPRRLWVHRAAGTTRGSLPLTVLLDGQMWVESAPTIVDNLVADGLLPPGLTVLLGSGGPQQRMRDLTGDPGYLRFLLGGLLDWLGARWPISSDPARRAIVGQSIGGGTAVRAALASPRRYGNALVQSAAFGGGTVLPDDVAAGLSKSPHVRFFLEVGALEDRLLPVNRSLRNSVAGAGLPHSYREYAGGHELLSWQGGLADGLRYLLGVSARVPHG